MKILKRLSLVLSRNPAALCAAGLFAAACHPPNSEGRINPLSEPETVNSWENDGIQFDLQGVTASSDERTCLESASRGLMDSVRAGTLVPARVYVHRDHPLVRSVIDNRSLTIATPESSKSIVRYSVALDASSRHVVVHDAKSGSYAIRDLPAGTATLYLESCLTDRESRRQ